MKHKGIRTDIFGQCYVFDLIKYDASSTWTLDSNILNAANSLGSPVLELQAEDKDPEVWKEALPPRLVCAQETGVYL